jgi:hypothetical protein
MYSARGYVRLEAIFLFACALSALEDKADVVFAMQISAHEPKGLLQNSICCLEGRADLNASNGEELNGCTMKFIGRSTSAATIGENHEKVSLRLASTGSLATVNVALAQYDATGSYAPLEFDGSGYSCRRERAAEEWRQWQNSETQENRITRSATDWSRRPRCCCW